MVRRVGMEHDLFVFGMVCGYDMWICGFINRSGGVYPSYLVIHIQAASRNVGP